MPVPDPLPLPPDSPPVPHDFPPADIAEETMADQLDNVVPEYGYHKGTVVGLGGSAGSLAALKAFFAGMPPDTGLTFVVVTHLSPDHESLMAEILQKVTTMPVTQVQASVVVEPDHIYVIPPSRHLTMMNGHLALAEMEGERGRRVAVDLFLRTLADTHGPHSIGIILSGADGDGAIGIKRIKERGGLAIVQDPGEAEQDGMPQSAIATGMIDWVLPVSEMPARILRYVRTEARLRLPAETPPASGQPSGEGGPTGMESVFGEILSYLRLRTGRDFSYYKRPTVVRRIARRMQVHALEDLQEYLSLLRTHRGEARALLEDLLISVTNFFRDADAFNALEEEIPALFTEKGPESQVRVWVAGCATGEEAYSVTMLLMEHAARLESPPSIVVFATDLDEEALKKARSGVYPDTITADVSEERLRRFFTREAGRLRVRTEVRERILFSGHDLFGDAPFSRLDLVTCRNLFIYVNKEIQRRGLELFHFALRPGGWLFLGSAEAAEELGLFKPLNKKHKIYIRAAVERGAPPVLPAAATSFQTNGAVQRSVLQQPAGQPARFEMSSLPPPRQEALDGWKALHFELLDAVAPASVLINADYKVVHLSRQAGRWLRLGGGQLSNDLLELLSPVLRLEVRTALFRVAQEGGVDEREMVAENAGGASCRVRLQVGTSPLAPGYFLVVFEECSAEPAGIPVPPGNPPDQSRVHQLDEELQHTRGRLRDLEEQHRASLEELKAGNEELQSMNEELRSAGEELETSREELQSINEELQSVNQELKNRVEELSGSNSDLRNLMASTSIATIFLDREMKIMRYTPPAVEIFNFIPTDVGRPLSDLTHRMEYPEIVNHARRVLANLVPVEHEIHAEGRWFLTRLQPYRTIDDHIAGVVLTFVDITQRKRTEEALAESGELLRRILENAREYAIFAMDADRAVTTWNAGAERLLGYAGREIKGQSGDVIFTAEDRANGEPEKEAVQALAEGRVSNERWHQRRDGSLFWGSGVTTAMRDPAGKIQGLLKIMRDHTQDRLRLEEVQKARAEAEEAGKAKDHILAVVSHELRTPLTPVLLNIDLLMESPGMPEDSRPILRMMLDNILTEVRLIEDLLDVTKITHGKFTFTPEPVDVHAVIGEVIANCQAEMKEKNHRCLTALHAARATVMGDPLRVRQVVWNVLRNAIKFTPAGGTLEITTRDAPEALAIEVRDSGIGMNAKTLEAIFQPFAQGNISTSKKFGGLGLGLAISRAAVEAHGGTVQARSDGPGKGSVFEIILPSAGGDWNNKG